MSQAVNAIVDKKGKVVFNAITTAVSLGEHDAWRQFFIAKAHQFPLAEAIKAYKAIGYRCVKFELVEVTE